MRVLHPVGVVWVFCLVVSLSGNCGASDLTPAEIMEKCNEAMKPPIQYRIKVNKGVDSVLSQQHVLADGSVATRTEIVILNMPRISVQSGTDMYEWYPNTKICIDTQLIYSAVKQKADDVKKMVDNIKSLPILTARPNEVVVGKPCYVLDQEPSQEMLAAFKKMIPGDALPPIKRMYIDVKSFQFVRVEDISFRTKAIVSAMDYLEFSSGSKFDPEMFLPPNGYVIHKPKDVREYTRLISKAMLPVNDEFSLQKRKMREPIGKLKIDPDTGMVILPVFPVPPGMTREQYDMIIEKKVAEVKSGHVSDESDSELERMNPVPIDPKAALLQASPKLLLLLVTMIIVGYVIKKFFAPTK